MMRRSKNKALFALMTAAIVILLGSIFFRTICYWLIADTEYSSDFKKKAWNRVEVGMSESEIKSIIGEPISVDQWTTEPDKKTFNYSRSPSNNSTFLHYYVVIQNGRVIEKKKEVFWD